MSERELLAENQRLRHLIGLAYAALELNMENFRGSVLQQLLRREIKQAVRPAGPDGEGR